MSVAAQDLRTLCAQAGRWLQVARYQPDARYWAYGTHHAVWHVLVDPDAPDDLRLWAVRSALARLDGAAAYESHEQIRTADHPRERWDPHDAMWDTTLRGAALETAREHLTAAAAILDARDVEPRKPDSELYARISAVGATPRLLGRR